MKLEEIFKTEEVYKRSKHLHPIALAILMEMFLYCYERDLEFVVTSTVSTLEEDKELSRISSTHRSGRAFDIRKPDSWNYWDVQKFKNLFNEKYKHYGAVDKYGKSHLIVDIPHGTGPHFHVQINRIYSLDLSKEDL